MIAELLLQRPHSLFIGGRWRAPAAPQAITVLNPSTGRPLAEIAGAGAGEVDAAVAASTAAFPAWRLTTGYDRGGWLRGFARGLAQREPVLIELQMLNNGKPRGEAETDVRDAIAAFDYYAALAERLEEEQESAVALPDRDYSGRTRYEPLGPVGMIVPWNFPLVTSAWKIAPALAAGCTLVLKTSEYTPFAELVYADIAAEIGLPPGVLNILTGAGQAGAALAADRRLRKVSFTGSNAVGSKVMASAAERCMPVSLELGGKSPIVVFADFPVEQAVDCIVAGIFYNCGQMCSATSRLIVEESAAGAVLECLVERCRAINVGSPFESQSRMGPLTTQPQYHKVLATFEQARTEGLRRLFGGAPVAKDGGFFVTPTVYAEVPLDSTAWTQEIFGPVLAVRTFATETQAVELANRSEFGLVATVVSADPERARRVAAAIDAGHVWINSVQVIFPETAWGGFKASGIGRELGPWGLHAYTGVKHITLHQDRPG
ncbi:MAG TPA: aldehyde dehydrogenase family protein [Alphaproteobacteria bacterium]|nr:aldehyde dehydrogenase family protein [Alphaproteobacteria bacterium]